jgi:hypothetical protein
MADCETFDHVFDGQIVECVRDPGDPENLLLDTWNGHRSKTAPTFEHEGISFVAKSLAGELVRVIGFPPPSRAFGSTSDLIQSLRTFLSTYAHLRTEDEDVLVAFALATWFCDLMPIAPVLYLFGPEAGVSQVLRLLGCLCRRAVLLSGVDLEALARLPSGLGATLLINQRDLTRRVRRTLLASDRRHFCMLRRAGRLDLYGGKAFSCESFLDIEHGLAVSIAPAQCAIPFLTDTEQQSSAQNFQARLLRYRMLHYTEVSVESIDCGSFAPELREQAHSWLAPLADSRELSDRIFRRLSQQSREATGARFFDRRCIVAEAALAWCHKGASHVFVGELAGFVNALLKGRHEEEELTPKRVGLLLRELGINAERVTEGYKIVLDDKVRKRIHEIANDYQVLSLGGGKCSCPYCSNKEATPSYV